MCAVTARSEARWRVAVTRDEGAEGPLTAALRAHGFDPVPCHVMAEQPGDDVAAVRSAARRLETFDWLVCSSARAVRALAAAREGPWPRGLRTAAVGRRTADALLAAGAVPDPLTAPESGAEALWGVMEAAGPWTRVRVLVPTVPGGRRHVIDGLRLAGADVEEVEAYRMQPRTPGEIAADWAASAPDAVVVASPSAARALVGAIGAPALAALRAVVAIGHTTAGALTTLGVHADVPSRADFAEAVALLSRRRDGGAPA